MLRHAGPSDCLAAGTRGGTLASRPHAWQTLGPCFFEVFLPGCVIQISLLVNDQPERRHESGIGQHVDGLLLGIVELTLFAEEYVHHAVRTSDVLHLTAIAVDQHVHYLRRVSNSGSSCHVRRTVDAATDNYGSDGALCLQEAHEGC
jgi:hypothetical protein